MPAQPTSAQASLQTLLLPLNGFYLLAPQSMVVEITSYPKLTQGDADTSAWLLGLFEWRTAQVPLISFEMMSGIAATAARAKKPHIAVLYTLQGKPRFEYYALALTAIPKPALLSAASLANKLEFSHETIAESVSIEGKNCIVPAPNRIERLIQNELQRLEQTADSAAS